MNRPASNWMTSSSNGTSPCSLSFLATQAATHGAPPSQLTTPPPLNDVQERAPCSLTRLARHPCYLPPFLTSLPLPTPLTFHVLPLLLMPSLTCWTIAFQLNVHLSSTSTVKWSVYILPPGTTSPPIKRLTSVVAVPLSLLKGSNVTPQRTPLLTLNVCCTLPISTSLRYTPLAP